MIHGILEGDGPVCVCLSVYEHVCAGVRVCGECVSDLKLLAAPTGVVTSDGALGFCIVCPPASNLQPAFFLASGFLSYWIAGLTTDCPRRRRRRRLVTGGGHGAGVAYYAQKWFIGPF